ncbi:hypothetical protein, partial [Acinetobacter baumannii]|uniref:hypothetical protein n=1 Tax=Acinetobacter baumannii TaxID=470 RepID=UPI001D174EB0
MPVRYSRWRLLVAVVLLLLFVALLIAGRLLHWDDQLRLYSAGTLFMPVRYSRWRLLVAVVLLLLFVALLIAG